MNRKFSHAIGISLLILTLFGAMAMQSVSAITLKKVRTWIWGLSETEISSTAEGDVDGDGKIEIVTGGSWLDVYECHRAQLCVWDAVTLTLENVQSWVWGDEAWINSVAVGDVDGDGKAEIVTGGYYMDDTWVHFMHAQLCVWNGATLALEKVVDWQEKGNDTYVMSVAVGDVDGNGKTEIITGGNIRNRAPTPDQTYGQLCVWDGASLALKDEFTLWFLFNWWFNSVAVGDVDGDGKTEIVTGGYCELAGHKIASMWVFDGATLSSETTMHWSWSESSTVINSVAVGDVDGDGKTEIVTGGSYFDGTRDVAQLCVWNGATLALENVRFWYWTGDTVINSVAVGDVDGDGKTDIVTGGFCIDGYFAQLCVWNGATLALKDVRTWKWEYSTVINSVAVGDVDGDGKAEMVTGGCYYDWIEWELLAQLCVWDW